MIYQKIGYFGKHKIVWKALSREQCCLSRPEPTNRSKVHTFSTSGVGRRDINESGTVWMRERYGNGFPLKLIIIVCITVDPIIGAF